MIRLLAAAAAVAGSLGCGHRAAAPAGREAAPLPAEVETLRAGLADGTIEAAAALVDPAWAEVRDLPAFRRLMRDHLTGAVLTIVPPGEPGVPLTVTGTVRDTDGAPVAGARIHVFQTDARGWYGVRASDDDDHPRLFGHLRTGADGRYELRTVRPGHYAHAPSTPSHIHYAFTAEGHRRARGHGPPSLFFADDPKLLPEHHAEIEGDGAQIAEVHVAEDGSQHCVYDLVLRRE